MSDAVESPLWSGLAWAVQRSSGNELRLFLQQHRADQYAADHPGHSVIALTSMPMPGASPMAWVTLTATGPGLWHDRAAAERYVSGTHGTVHDLYPIYDRRPEPASATRRPRMPQGELTPGGVMRL